MEKYKLINSVTKIETICDKVTIDGFDYYVSDEEIKIGDINIPSDFSRTTDLSMTSNSDLPIVNEKMNGYRKVIATNNPNIDVPKVADEDLGLNYLMSLPNYEYLSYWVQDMIKKAYNKSQETHPFSDEDMIEFGEWCKNLQKDNKEIRRSNPSITTKELLQLWKEQKPKIVYYG